MNYVYLIDQFSQIIEVSQYQSFQLGRGHLEICTDYISALAPHFIILGVLTFLLPPQFFLIYLFLLFVFMTLTVNIFHWFSTY